MKTLLHKTIKGQQEQQFDTLCKIQVLFLLSFCYLYCLII